MCRQWCRWIASLPKVKNPALGFPKDETWQINNLTNIIFLCQRFDFHKSGPLIPIPLSIPKSSMVFMPIINWVYALEEKEGRREEELKKIAKGKMDEAANLSFSINGIPITLDLSIFRIGPIVSESTLTIDNIFGMAPRSTSIIADGFWLLFQPLVSELILDTHGTCQSGTIRISISYRITLDGKG
jgi:hypothetical protein